MILKYHVGSVADLGPYRARSFIRKQISSLFRGLYFCKMSSYFYIYIRVNVLFVNSVLPDDETKCFEKLDINQINKN